MSSITRTRIRCRERACPWPFDEEMHEVPWCRGIKEHKCFGGVEHQHWPKRSQGGKEIVSLLCSGAHQLIDSGPWGNAVKEINGKRVYMIWDLHGEILYERDIGGSDERTSAMVGDSDAGCVGDNAGVVAGQETLAEASSAAAEVPETGGNGAETLASAPGASASTGEGEDLSLSGGGLAGGSDASRDSLPSPAGVSAHGAATGSDNDGGTGWPPNRDQSSEPAGASQPEERVGRDSEAGAQPAGLSGVTPSENLAVTPPDSLDYWCQRGIALLVQGFRLQKIVVAWAFEVGDWWNEGEMLLGQKVHQYDAQFSYWQLTKFASVAGRVPKESRRLDLSRDKDGPLTFEHYRVVAFLSPPEQREQLETAVVNRESAAKLKARLLPPPEKQEAMQRWTLEELRERLAEWPGETSVRNNGRKFAEAWLDWLGKA